MITGNKKNAVVVSDGVSGRIDDAESLFGLEKRKGTKSDGNNNSNNIGGKDKLFEDVDWEEEFRKNALS